MSCDIHDYAAPVILGNVTITLGLRRKTIMEIPSHFQGFKLAIAYLAECDMTSPSSFEKKNTESNLVIMSYEIAYTTMVKLLVLQCDKIYFKLDKPTKGRNSLQKGKIYTYIPGAVYVSQHTRR